MIRAGLEDRSATTGQQRDLFIVPKLVSDSRRPLKLCERCFDSSDCGLLMGFQSDCAQVPASSFRAEGDLRNSGANDLRRR